MLRERKASGCAAASSRTLSFEEIWIAGNSKIEYKQTQHSEEDRANKLDTDIHAAARYGENTSEADASFAND